MKKDEIIRLEQLLQNPIPIDKEVSILGLLGAKENDISKILGYLIEKYPTLFEAMICLSNPEFEFSVQDINVEVEKSIDNQKRIDIYIYGTFTNNIKFYCIIENKTWSQVHGNQCELYASWLENNYKDGIHYYFLLKPSSNITSANCDKYKTITYEDLSELLNNVDDSCAYELNKTIKNNFVGANMTELEQLILTNNNYKVIKNAISNVQKALDNFFDKELYEKVKYSFKDFEFQKAGQSRRFYLPKWWSDYKKDNLQEQYYFYVEYILRDYDFDSLEIQAVVKRYCPDSFVDTLFENEFNDKVLHKTDSGNNRWYVLKSFKFVSTYDILSNEWKQEFADKVIYLFQEYIKIISDEIFPKFEELLK